MDADKLASIATMSGVTGLTLNLGTIAAGIAAAAGVAGLGYITYKIGSRACEKFSALRDAEKLAQDGPELAN